MESYQLAASLQNLIVTLNKNLPVAVAERFNALVNQQIADMPDQFDVARAEGQITGDGPFTEGRDYVGYLEVLCHWFGLSLLVDAEIGVLRFATTPADRGDVLRLAKVYLRWLDGDYPSEEEWEAAGEASGVAEGQVRSAVQDVVFNAGLAHTLSPMGIQFYAVSAAQFYQGKPTPAWADQPIGEPEGCLTALWKWPLRFLVRTMILKPEGGNPRHYLAQAHCVLQLLRLRWVPDEPAEKALFQGILKGDLALLTKYGQALNAAGLDPKTINQTATVLRKLVNLRSFV